MPVGQRSTPPRPSAHAALLAALLLLPACKRDDIRSYSVPKEPEPPAQPEPATPAPTAAAPAVAWTLPAGWSEVPSTQPMRKATFKTGAGAEVTVSAFAGEAGGLIANLNRWRGQVGLPAATPEDLAKNCQRVPGPAGEIITVRFDGSAQSLVGAVAQPGDGQTWFVKAMTDAAGAAAITDDIRTFTLSLRTQAAPAKPSTPTTAAAPPAAQDNPVLARLSALAPPEGWTKAETTSAFTTAAFLITSPGGEARMTISGLSGPAGGVLANINRWRDQLGLPAVATLAEASPTDLGSGACLVEFGPPADDKRTIGAIIPGSDSSWFFKLTGAAPTVRAQREAFLRVVRGVGLGQ